MEKATWKTGLEGSAMERSLRRVTRQVLVDELMILGANPKTSPEARAVVMQHLVDLKGNLAGMKEADPVSEALLRQTERDLTRYLANPAANAPRAASLPQPAGAPL